MTNRQFRRAETLSWLSFAIVPILIYWDVEYIMNIGVLNFLFEFFFRTPLGLPFLSFLAIPFLFSYIFGAPPLTYYRTRHRSDEEIDGGGSAEEIETLQLEGSEDPDVAESQGEPIAAEVSAEAPGNGDLALGRLDETVLRSRAAKDTALRRANVQLFAGAFIGLLGLVAFFALESVSPQSGMPELSGVWEIALWKFLATLPRIMVLVFIELLAGFFLRQYRIAMEEYRYFEKSFRSQEMLRVSYIVRREHGATDDLLALAERIMEQHPPDLLRGDQTTELIEVQKLAVNEFQGLYNRILKTVETAVSSVAKEGKNEPRAANPNLETDG